MTIPAWTSRAEFEAWWREHGRAFRLLSVSDPEEWERIARKIEAFNARNPR